VRVVKEAESVRLELLITNSLLPQLVNPLALAFPTAPRARTIWWAPTGVWLAGRAGVRDRRRKQLYMQSRMFAGENNFAVA
jgi:hypothetical protein